MAEHAMHIDMVEVKPEDIIADRRSTYAGFIAGAQWSLGLLIALLVLIYLIWG
jgi:hypothetical protein